MKGLKAIREERAKDAKKFTITAVSEAIGVSRKTLRLFEEDPSRMTGRQASALADYLDCSVEDIFLTK